MKKGGNPTSRRRDRALENGSSSYKEKRLEIAKVAAGLFNRHGYAGTSLAAVARELKTDRAALYYYIADKRELFDEVVREVAEAHVVSAEEVGKTEAPALDKLRSLVIALMASYGETYPLLFVHMRENLSHVASNRTGWGLYMRALNRRFEDVFIRIIEDGIADGTIRRVASPRIMAFGIIGMINWSNRWYVPGKTKESATEIGAAYADMVLAGIRVDVVAR